MFQSESVQVVGSTVGALATAERLAASGCRVELYATGVPGGHFAGVQLGGHRVEAGIRLIEREYVSGENALPFPPLNEHVPGHGGHRRWMGMVEQYLCDLVPDLVVAPAPRLMIDGRCVEDFTLTGRLSTISQIFSEPELREIASDAEAAILRFGDGSGIFASSDYPTASIGEASVANHGQLFHRRVVEPLTNSLIPGGSDVVAADQRHKVWAPLFWPLSLRQAAVGGELHFKPDRKYWVDGRGGMRAVVEALSERLRASDRVTIVDAGPIRSLGSRGVETTFEFSSGSVLRSAAPVIGLSPGELFRAAGIPYESTRVKMNLAWAAVADQNVVDASAVTMLNSETGVFRISASAPAPDPSGTSSRIFCLELRHDARPDRVLVEQALEAAGVVVGPEFVSYLGALGFDAFVTPSHSNRSSFAEAHSHLTEAVPGAVLVGGAAGYGADPINEQLFSGIRAGLELSGAHV